MLELFHWEPNTFFLKPLIALKEKDVEFASRYFDPTRFEQFAEQPSPTDWHVLTKTFGRLDTGELRPAGHDYLPIEVRSQPAELGNFAPCPGWIGAARACGEGVAGQLSGARSRW